MNRTNDSLRLLLIDDNPDDRVLVIRELERAFPGIAVNEINSLAGFERALAEKEFHAVVTDYQLGWTTGLKVLEAIRSACLDCPVIMFTGTGTQETAVEAMKRGLDDYVVKSPRQYIRLPAALRNAMQRRADTQARRYAEFRLREHEQWLKAILRSITEGVIAADDSGRIRFINPEAGRLTGWDWTEALDRAADQVLQLLDEKGKPLAESPAARALGDKQVSTEQQVFLLTRRDGTLIPVIHGAAPILSDDGRLLGAVMSFHDLTEQKRVETALLRSNESLQRFAYAASHDLKEPLRTVGLHTQLLARRLTPEEREKVQESLDYIVGGARRMNELVNAVLAYATDTTSGAPRRINAADALLAAMDNLDSVIRDTGARIDREPLPDVVVDPPQLTIVFQNLLSNAMKYRGSEPLRIQVGAKPDPEGWRFYVEDNGLGIPARHHERVFGLFKRLEPRKTTGTGIGLTLSRQIVEAYGGRIWVESDGVKGATFYFTLPNAEERTDDTAVSPPAP